MLLSMNYAKLEHLAFSLDMLFLIKYVYMFKIKQLVLELHCGDQD